MSIGRLGVPVRNLPGSTTLLPDLHEASIAHRGKGAAGQPPGARRALPSLNRPGLATQAWRRAPEACALRVPWLECHRKQATARPNSAAETHRPVRPFLVQATASSPDLFTGQQEPVPCKPMRSPAEKCVTRLADLASVHMDFLSRGL